MLLKAVLETYDRYLTTPASDPLLRNLAADVQEMRYQRVHRLRALVGKASPFILDAAALDLVAPIRSGVESAEDIGPLLLEAPLPFDSIWAEFQEDIEHERLQSGVLIHTSGSGLLVCGFHRPVGGPVNEPLMFLSVNQDGKPDVSVDPFTSAKLIRGYEGTQDERVGQVFADAFPQTGWAILNVVSALHLIGTRRGPLDAAEEPMFSRPERRRLERSGELAKGAAPTVTRIRINDQGRLHLQAIDEEEGGAGGARRRAHRVRGHYMRTAKGFSWRRAHVRGAGPVNETVRVIGAEVAAEDDSGEGPADRDQS